MALAGTLKDFGLPDIVQLIGLQRKTGTLHLETPGEKVKVIFEGGNIVAAESSMTRPSDRIGNALVTQGAITQDQLDRALSVQKQTMQRLGHVLISEQIVNEDTLRKAVEAQAWADGAAVMGRIRRLVGCNLIVGLVLVAIAAARPSF